MPLTHSQARRYYGWFGRKQDRQGVYEDAALQVLVEYVDFEHANCLYAPMVDGCRPQQLLPYLDSTSRGIAYHQLITRLGVPSQVLIAQPRH